MHEPHVNAMSRTSGSGKCLLWPSCPSAAGRRRRWWEQDSNLRRLSQRVYSPSPLTARESHRAAASLAPNPRPARVDDTRLGRSRWWRPWRRATLDGVTRWLLALMLLAIAAPAAHGERVLRSGTALWVDP